MQASNITPEAMDRLRDEMAKNAEDEGIAFLGEYLTERLMAEPEIAGKLKAEGKSLEGAWNEVIAYARKNQKGGFCTVSDGKAREIACAYYGIAEKAEEQPHAAAAQTKEEPAALDLDALLGA